MAEETHPLFAGFGNRTGRAIGSHHSARAGTAEWLTPPFVLEALGEFDLDPCAPVDRPWPTAKRHYTIRDNGLILPWGDSRIWLNPPYATQSLMKWLGRMADHNHGTALIFARTETRPFFRFVWERATAVLFIRGRLTFHRPDGSLCTIVDKRTGRIKEANGGAPSVLIAYGQDDAEILAYCSIAGQFVPLRIPRSVLVEAISETWRAALESWFAERDGPIDLADLYRAFADHPKAKANPNYQAKLRQELQRGPFERVGRGKWTRRP